MRNFFQSLLKDGNLKEKVMNWMDLVGLALIWGGAYFFEKWEGFLFWMVMLTGGALAYTSSYGGLAKKFGYKPFTNDPLGWRKAKESYLKKDGEEESKSSVNSSAEDLKK